MSASIETEAAKIRAAYPWLDERIIMRYAEIATKNREANGHNKD